jgi:hypothetical protein
MLKYLKENENEIFNKQNKLGLETFSNHFTTP